MAFPLPSPLALALVLAAPAMAQPAPAGQPPAARMSAAECEVWSRELGFAQTVADRDAAAFAEFLHPQAAFGSGRAEPTRGREAITREWSSLIAGKQVALSWYPTRTTIAGDGDIAASSGPALYEHLAPDADPRFTMSRFHSVWHKGEDGVWRVVFDDGTASRPVTEAEVAAFKAARLSECPRG